MLKAAAIVVRMPPRGLRRAKRHGRRKPPATGRKAACAFAAENENEGLAILERAREHELRGGPAWDRPDPVSPRRSFWRESYLELGRKQEAAAYFTETLRRRPGRALALLGVARARRG